MRASPPSSFTPPRPVCANHPRARAQAAKTLPSNQPSLGGEPGKPALFDESRACSARTHARTHARTRTPPDESRQTNAARQRGNSARPRHAAGARSSLWKDRIWQPHTNSTRRSLPRFTDQCGATLGTQRGGEGHCLIAIEADFCVKMASKPITIPKARLAKPGASTPQNPTHSRRRRTRTPKSIYKIVIPTVESH